MKPVPVYLVPNPNRHNWLIYLGLFASALYVLNAVILTIGKIIYFAAMAIVLIGCAILGFRILRAIKRSIFG